MFFLSPDCLVWRESTQTQFGKLPNTLASDWSMSGPPGPLIGRTHSVLYSGPGHPRMETDLRTCLRRGRSRSQSPVPLAVCLRVSGRGEYCALCLCLPAIPHKIFTRNIMGFKTIQTQPRSAWSGRLAGWCEATFDISFNYPLPSPRSDVWSGLKHPMWHHTLQ